MEPTHLHRQVENATAPSAGDSPDGEGLPQRTQRGIGRGGMQRHRSSYQPLPWPVETRYL
ncbi:MAG: hypothetical protein ACOX52_17255 [Verrucomicrobiota bacterium]